MDTARLRHRLKQRTRDEIEDAAFALFAERGYAATTVEQIAVAAGVSPRTFFRYFPAKEAVLFTDHEATLASFRAALAATPDGESPLRRVRAALEATRPGGDRPQRHLERAKLVAAVPSLRARQGVLIEALEDAVADALAAELGGGEEGRLRALIAGAAIFGAMRGGRRAAELYPDRSARSLFATVFDVLADLDRSGASPAVPAADAVSERDHRHR